MKRQRSSSRKSVLKAVFLLIASMLCMLATSYFSWNVVQYSLRNFDIKAIENEAKVGKWTANGYIHWTQELIEEYERAMEKKQKLIETEDVARWIYHSGYSMTGKILRVATIVCAIILDILSVICIIDSTRYLLKKLVRLFSK